jgi:hypothetical protein
MRPQHRSGAKHVGIGVGRAGSDVLARTSERGQPVVDARAAS